MPAAVFADPQVASVGLTEAQARATGRPYLSAVRDYSTTAYGWALEDTTSFAKVIADPRHGCYSAPTSWALKLRPSSSR